MKNFINLWSNFVVKQRKLIIAVSVILLAGGGEEYPRHISDRA